MLSKRYESTEVDRRTWKFYGRYGNLIKQYEAPLARMLHDILENNHLQWHYVIYWSGITPILTLLLILT